MSNPNQITPIQPFNQPRIHVAAADDIVFYSTHKVYLFEYSFAPLLKYVNTNEIPANNEILSLHYKSDDITLADGCAFPFYPFIAVLGDGSKSESSRRIVRVFDYFTGTLILKYKYSHLVLGVRSVGNLILTILHNKIVIQALPLQSSSQPQNVHSLGLTSSTQEQNFGMTSLPVVTQPILPMEPRTVPTATNQMGIYAVHDAAAHTQILSQLSQFILPAHITSLLEKYTFNSNLPVTSIAHSFVCFPQTPPQNAHEDPVIQGYKGFVGILDLVTLQHTKTIPVCKGVIQHLKLSPDGHLLAVASDKGTLIRVFNTTTGGLMHTFRRGHNPATICSMAFSFHNELLAVASLNSKVIHVFKLATEQFNDDHINLIADIGSFEELDFDDEAEFSKVRLDLDGIEPELVPNVHVPATTPLQLTPSPSTTSNNSSWTRYFSWGNLAAATSTASTYASSLVSAGANVLTNVVGMVEPPRNYGYAIVNHIQTTKSNSNHNSPLLQSQKSSPPLIPQSTTTNSNNNTAILTNTISAINSYLPNSISGHYNDSDIYIADLRVYCIYSHTPSNEINSTQQQQNTNNNHAESLLTVCGYFVLAFCTNGSVYIYRGGKGPMKLIKEEPFLPTDLLIEQHQQQQNNTTNNQQQSQQRRQSLSPTSKPLQQPTSPNLPQTQSYPKRDSLSNHTPSTPTSSTNSHNSSNNNNIPISTNTTIYAPSNRNENFTGSSRQLHSFQSPDINQPSNDFLDMSTPMLQHIKAPDSSVNTSTTALPYIHLPPSSVYNNNNNNINSTSNIPQSSSSIPISTPNHNQFMNQNEQLQRKIEQLSPTLLVGSASPKVSAHSSGPSSFDSLSLDNFPKQQPQFTSPNNQQQQQQYPRLTDINPSSTSTPQQFQQSTLSPIPSAALSSPQTSNQSLLHNQYNTTTQQSSQQFHTSQLSSNSTNSTPSPPGPLFSILANSNGSFKQPSLTSSSSSSQTQQSQQSSQTSSSQQQQQRQAPLQPTQPPHTPSENDLLFQSSVLNFIESDPQDERHPNTTNNNNNTNLSEPDHSNDVIINTISLHPSDNSSDYNQSQPQSQPNPQHPQQRNSTTAIDNKYKQPLLQNGQNISKTPQSDLLHKSNLNPQQSFSQGGDNISEDENSQDFKSEPIPFDLSTQTDYDEQQQQQQNSSSSTTKISPSKKQFPQSQQHSPNLTALSQLDESNMHFTLQHSNSTNIANNNGTQSHKSFQPQQQEQTTTRSIPPSTLSTSTLNSQSAVTYTNDSSTPSSSQPSSSQPPSPLVQQSHIQQHPQSPQSITTINQPSLNELFSSNDSHQKLPSSQQQSSQQPTLPPLQPQQQQHQQQQQQQHIEPIPLTSQSPSIGTSSSTFHSIDTSSIQRSPAMVPNQDLDDLDINHTPTHHSNSTQDDFYHHSSPIHVTSTQPSSPTSPHYQQRPNSSHVVENDKTTNNTSPQKFILPPAPQQSLPSNPPSTTSSIPPPPPPPPPPPLPVADNNDNKDDVNETTSVVTTKSSTSTSSKGSSRSKKGKKHGKK